MKIFMIAVPYFYDTLICDTFFRWIGDRSEDETPVELPVPIIYMSANKRGPVGGNTDDTPACRRTFFNSFSWLKSENLVLKGFRLRASKYIDAIQIIGSKNYPNDGGTFEFAFLPFPFLDVFQANGTRCVLRIREFQNSPPLVIKQIGIYFSPSRSQLVHVCSRIY